MNSLHLTKRIYFIPGREFINITLPIFSPDDHFVCGHEVPPSPCLSIFTRTWTKQGVVSSIKHLGAKEIHFSIDSTWLQFKFDKIAFTWKKTSETIFNKPRLSQYDSALRTGSQWSPGQSSSTGPRYGWPLAVPVLHHPQHSGEWPLYLTWAIQQS